jgi:uncharacterized membrane protein
MVKPSTKSTLHLAYLVGIALKGVDGLLEICGGAILLLTSRPAIIHVIASLTRAELYEDPRDFVATHALHIAENLSPGTQYFASAYLLVHGAIKVGLVGALMRGWRQAYPAALLLLTAFIAYQGYRLFRYHSPMLTVFTAIDVAIVLLIWHEWKHHSAG